MREKSKINSFGVFVEDKDVIKRLNEMTEKPKINSFGVFVEDKDNIGRLSQVFQEVLGVLADRAFLLLFLHQAGRRVPQDQQVQVFHRVRVGQQVLKKIF